MSIESLLLIGFLIVIPLLERLVRVLRARSSGAQVQHPSNPAPTSPPPSPSRRPLPAAAAGTSSQMERAADRVQPTPPPPLLAPRHPAPERLTSRDRARARRENPFGPVAPVSVGRSAQQRPRGFALGRISGAADLRRGIVLMAILGPCRALRSEDASHRPW